jgi:hypothetical protein
VAERADQGVRGRVEVLAESEPRVEAVVTRYRFETLIETDDIVGEDADSKAQAALLTKVSEALHAALVKPGGEAKFLSMGLFVVPQRDRLDAHEV